LFIYFRKIPKKPLKKIAQKSYNHVKTAAGLTSKKYHSMAKKIITTHAFDAASGGVSATN
jgi:hypothetical protein